MYFLIQIEFQRSDRVELDFWGSVIKIALNLRSQGAEKKSNFPPKEHTTFKFWEMKLLLLNYKYAKIFKFAVLDIKS